MRDQTITAWNLLSISDPVEHVSFYFLLNLHRRSLTGSKLLNTPPKKLNLTSTSETWIWTRNLDPGPEKPGLILRPGPRPWSETLKNLNPEKYEPWKTWNKYEIKKYGWLKSVIFYKDQLQFDLDKFVY